ncbi:hypothetical protein Y1Q_0008465 [Alligator mississippiensis]|uniref:Uncharacterized protein n=1 Tax=Alligator mississippiensis TaxID=8496 RepID=A0A151MUS1_ALLMI|nr:hypothetical protein Y1Q_0008465 [Alligator mississippiensis]
MGPQDASVSDSASLSMPLPAAPRHCSSGDPVAIKAGSATLNRGAPLIAPRTRCKSLRLDPQGTTDHHLQVKPRTIAVRPGVGSGIVAENHRGGARQSSQGILTRITTVT